MPAYLERELCSECYARPVRILIPGYRSPLLPDSVRSPSYKATMCIKCVLFHLGHRRDNPGNMDWLEEDVIDQFEPFYKLVCGEQP
jgi:hypothetical protein